MLNRVDLTDEQFLVVNELLNYVRLGTVGTFTKAISELLISMQDQGLEQVVSDIEDSIGDTVKVAFEYNDSDGMVISLN